MVVQWEQPAVHGASVTSYDVEYREAGASEWSSASHDRRIGMGSAPLCGANLGRCAVITGLATSGGTYETRVRSVIGDSTGAWSEVATATTRAVPDSPVLEAVTAVAGGLSVSWSAPADYGSAVSDYDVRYRALPNGEWVLHSEDGDDSASPDTATTWAIGGLSNGTMYAVQARAQNTVGESSWSLAVVGSPSSAAGGQAQAADPPALIGVFNDAAIANGTTVALDMAEHFSGADLVYTVEVTTTHQRTGESRTGRLNAIARNKVRGGWDDTVSVLMLSGGSAASQELTITVTASAGGASVSDSFTLSLVGEVPDPDLSPPVDPNPPAEDPPPADPPADDPPPADPPPSGPPPADPPPADPPHNPATLIEAFADLTLSDDQTSALDMADHFSGDGLTFVVEVTTTHQRTGESRTGLLGEIARNKIGGSWDGSVLTLEGGHAASQTLTVTITATDSEGERRAGRLRLRWITARGKRWRPPPQFSPFVTAPPVGKLVSVVP